MSADEDREEPEQDGGEGAPEREADKEPERKAEKAAEREADKERERKADRSKAAVPREEVAVAEAPVAQRAPGGGDGGPLAQIADKAWIGIVLLVPAAIITGMIQGAAAALLVLIAAALITVIALFWSSVRTLFGETQLSGADAYAIAAPRAEEEQKQAVLRALKDLEFERSVGKISDDDYAALVTKYRSEAKRLLRVLDEEAEQRRERVEHLVRKRLVAAGLAPLEAEVDTERAAPIAEPKKKKKKAKAEAVPPVPAAAEPIERTERRVQIEPLDEVEQQTEPSRQYPKAKSNIDITWKSPLPTKTKESAAYVAASKKCSECGTKNDPDANFCKKCGSKAFAGGKAKAVVTAKEAPAAEKAKDAEDAKDAPKPDEASSAAAEQEAAEQEAAIADEETKEAAR